MSHRTRSTGYKADTPIIVHLGDARGEAGREREAQGAGQATAGEAPAAPVAPARRSSRPNESHSVEVSAFAGAARRSATGPGLESSGTSFSAAAGAG